MRIAGKLADVDTTNVEQSYHNPVQTMKDYYCTTTAAAPTADNTTTDLLSCIESKLVKAPSIAVEK